MKVPRPLRIGRIVDVGSFDGSPRYRAVEWTASAMRIASPSTRVVPREPLSSLDRKDERGSFCRVDAVCAPRALAMAAEVYAVAEVLVIGQRNGTEPLRREDRLSP